MCVLIFCLCVCLRVWNSVTLASVHISLYVVNMCVCVCVRVCPHFLLRWRLEVYQCSSTATHCNTLQHTATHRTTLQHTTPLHSLLCRWSVCAPSGFIFVSTCALVYVYVSTRVTKSFIHVMYVSMALAMALLFLPMVWLSANICKWTKVGGGWQATSR